MPDLKECKERILSEDIRDFIVGRDASLWQGLLETEVCRQELEYAFQIVYATEEEVGMPLYELPYSAVPLVFAPTDMEALAQAGISQVQSLPGLELTGEGVMVAFVDTGIHYEDPVFRNLDGSSRIFRIWDQTEQSGTPPEGLLYGSEYTREMLDAALRAENPQEIVPSRDTDGHGTFVASVACGGGSPENRFIGAAPEADIVVVKLKEAKQYLRDYYFISQGQVCFQENDIMAALYYLRQIVRKEKRPMVICMALGSSFGGHSGATPLAAYMEVMANTTMISFTVGTGNEADKRHHYLGEIRDESGEEFELSVGDGVDGFSMELWTEIPNIFSISIISPTGDRSGRIPVRERTGTYDFVFEQTEVLVSYKILVQSTNSEVIFLRFENPQSGIWRLRAEPVQLEDGRFHVWLMQQDLMRGEAYFLRPSPEYTIMEPGNVSSAAASAFYNGADNSIAASSGRGYTRLNRIKPDFAAPGVGVLGVNLRGQFVTRSGSSISAAITAGAEALLAEWLARQGVYLDSVQFKNLLILGAARRTDRMYPNREWGNGELNLYQTFEVIRRF
ncbi:S8 family peptidase [Roseburia hominis]